MMGTTPADAYNYEVFEPAPYIETGCDGPVAGEALADASVWTLDGARLRLGGLTDRLLVLETGSTTCPLYRGNIRRMARVASRHPDVVFVVLYTREAHPGERRGAHRDRDDKLAVAGRLVEQAGEWRPVVVDDLGGSLHRRLEGAPNSVTVLDGDGRVRWYLHDNDPSAVGQVLDDLSAGRSPRVTRTRFRPPDPRTALAALLTGGRDALRDFLRGLPALLRWRISGGPRC
jgi:hypothetical protein